VVSSSSALREAALPVPRATTPPFRVVESPKLSHAPLSDAALAALLREDSRRGAAQLHQRFARQVRGWVVRLLGNDDDCADVVQQVFCKLLVHGSKLRDPERLSGWVRSITVYTVCEEIRKRQGQRSLARECAPRGPRADLMQDVQTRDLLLLAKGALNGLSERDRRLFVLHVVEGRSLGEVAELCGYSLATAKRRKRSAKRRFRLLTGNEPHLQARLSED
jgi:RNA polymerase sigma factor (sigma-70 family)